MIPSHRRVNANAKDPAFYQNPYRLYDEQRGQGLFYWEQYRMWAVCSFAGVNAVLRDRHFARTLPRALQPTLAEKVPVTESIAKTNHLCDFHHVEKYSLLNLEPPAHTRLRSLVNHAFIARQIKELAPQIARYAREMLTNIQPLGKADLLPSYATPLPALIIAEMLGVPAQYIPQLLHWSHAMVKVYTLTQSPTDEINANIAALEFADLLNTLIEQRRAQPTNDLLSHLATARIDGHSLNKDEIVSTAVLLLNAGHEATVHQSGNAIKTLLESGLDPACVFATAEQTERTVQEFMRYDAPLHLFTRYALQDVELEGVNIKQGEQIALLLAAANRDEARFTNANTFDPFRTDGGHVTLGAGIHYCVGAQLAKLELEISLPLVFSELPKLRLTASPSYANTFHFHGLEALEVSWNL